MVLHNPNNWHWVNKDASVWARQYLDKQLVGLSASGGNVTAKIDKILSMDGDVDVSQRKGKVITLFDVKMQLEYSGTIKGTEDPITGTINIPEVAHDTEEDEYVFDIDIYADAASKLPVKDLVRSQLTPQLRKALHTLGPALIAAHAKDLQHAAAQPPTTNTTSKTVSSSSVAKSSTPTPAANGTPGSKVNTTTVTSTEEFRTTAEELYATFTDPARIAAFTRATPKVFDGAVEGGRFELFGGNVSGTYEALKAPTTIVQKWRLAQWPMGHYSRLEITFDQNDVDSVTVMRVVWTGVPVGQEEVTRRNWGEYYVRSIKTTFGFGTIL